MICFALKWWKMKLQQTSICPQDALDLKSSNERPADQSLGRIIFIILFFSFQEKYISWCLNIILLPSRFPEMFRTNPYSKIIICSFSSTYLRTPIYIYRNKTRFVQQFLFKLLHKNFTPVFWYSLVTLTLF